MVQQVLCLRIAILYNIIAGQNQCGTLLVQAMQFIEAYICFCLGRQYMLQGKVMKHEH